MVRIDPRGVDGRGTERREKRMRAASLSSRLPKLVLASQSPRRRQLLSQYGLAHDAAHPGIDDGQLLPGTVSPEAWVMALAFLKASAGASAQEPGTALVLGADTVCVKDGEIVGQPRDAADAERILRLLQGGSHEVLTGVALVRTDRPGWRLMALDRARVTVGHIGDERIAEYVRSGQWRGKAGAYNLGERIEAGWPIQYEGDPTTVMGLPMRLLLDRLGRLAVGGGDSSAANVA